MDDDAKIIAYSIDYSMAASLSKRLNTPTKYIGKGRPKKTDYTLYEHPFDQKITKSLNK